MKNQSIIAIVILVSFSTSAIAYSLFSSSSPLSNNPKNVPEGMHRMPDGSLMGNMHGADENDSRSSMGMMNGMDHSMMMVKSEREFLEGMIPHHQEAVDTAKEVIARGGSTPEIKKLVEDIVTAQEKEITMMKEWYQTWYNQPYTSNTNAYSPMMRDLKNLNGSALDKVFLEDMIMHHMGAIMMAQSVSPYIEHNEMKDLTKAIVSSQSQEIEQMRTMLKGL